MEIFLVTGAAGFIGARTAEMLLEAGYTVVGLDNLNDYYAPALKAWRLDRLRQFSEFSFVEGDVADRSGLAQLFREYTFSAVLHLASRAGVRYSLEDPHVYLETNTLGTLNLLELMPRHNVRKFVMASTSSLYAGQPLPFREDAPVNQPISPYAATKKAAEVLAYTWHYLHGVDVSILRYFTVYGPAGRPDMSVFRFTKWIDEGQPIQLFGDGTQSRDFTYIDDIARGTIRAIQPAGYEIFNLGAGCQPVTLNRLVERIGERLGKPALIDYKDFHQADMLSTWADISKARRLLGWEPKISWEEGVDRAVDWYVANREWLGAVPV